VHSDHGEEFGENGRYGHQPDVTEELIHVPLVVWGLEESGRVETPVGLRELAPTIAELAGSPCPFAGRDLLSLDDDTRPWVVSKVFVDGERRAAVRTATHEFRRRNGRAGLVDVTSGSGESIGNERTTAFATALDRHVAAEREKEAVRSGGERLIVEGRV
jgi:arylsulfatase